MAEIELQRVNNVKSKSSLTAIKHFSTSFPSSPPPCPADASCSKSSRPPGWWNVLLPVLSVSTSVQHGAELPVASDHKATDRGEAFVLQAACKHVRGPDSAGRCVCVSLTEAEVTTSPGRLYHMSCPGTWNACLCTHCVVVFLGHSLMSFSHTVVNEPSSSSPITPIYGCNGWMDG